MDGVHFFLSLVFALAGGILVGWFIFKRKDKRVSYFEGPATPPVETKTSRSYVQKPSIEVAPGIEIFEYERFPERIRPGHAVELASETYRTFEPILHSVPTALLVRDAATKWILKFSPEVAEGLNRGLYHLAASTDGVQTVARDAQGRIVEHGRLVQAGISPVAAATIAWQILAIVTAQKFLSDINKRLASIESALDEIREMIDLQAWSSMEGAYKYLADKFDKMRKAPLSEEELKVLLNHIEDILKDSEKILSYFDGRATRHKSEILSRELDQSSAWFLPKYNLNNNFEFMRQKMTEYIRARFSCFAVYQLKMQACYLKACLPAVNKEGCLYDIQKLSDDLSEKVHEFHSECKKIREKIETLHGPWARRKTELEKQQTLKQQLENQERSVFDKLEYIDKESRRIEENIRYQIAEGKKPQYFQIEVKNKNITRVALLK